MKNASKVFSKSRFKNTSPATEDELLRVINDFENAAALAAKSGFDCLELHFGHGYLISNFLSPKLNKRKDDWGYLRKSDDYKIDYELERVNQRRHYAIKRYCRS